MRKSISKIIKEWKDEAHVDGIILVGAFPEVRKIIKICTDKPGLMIGTHGALLDKYKKKLKNICPSIENIEFIETDGWYIK